MRRATLEAAHVLVAFGITLAGMLATVNGPVTVDLIVSLLPGAAVATARRLEARQSPPTPQKTSTP